MSTAMSSVSRGSLPPIPDAQGRPRPPAAPVTAARWTGTPIRRHHPPPPAAKYRLGGPDEPALESVFPRRFEAWRHALFGALLWAAFLLPIPALVQWWYGWHAGPSPATWVMIIVGFLLVATPIMYFNETFPPPPIVAGAHWVGGRGDKRGARLYELAQIEISLGSEEPDPTLLLTDVHGTRVGMDPSLLESHPQLWALVYNGIRHSAAAGAEVDQFTTERLFLFDTPPEPGQRPADDPNP